MKKRSLRLLSLLMAIIFVIPVFSGCSKFLNLWNKETEAETEEDDQSAEVEVTRGEFICYLIEQLQYVYEYDDTEIPFTDIEGHSYENYIRTAAQYGIISIEEDKFNPDKAATREFASTTAIKSIGYTSNIPLQCADAADIDEPRYAYLAIDLGMLSLIDNKFLPDKPLTVNECNDIINVVSLTVNSITGPDGTEKGVAYNKGLIKLNESESEILSMDEGSSTLSLPLSDNTSSLKTGDIIMLDNGYAYKVLTSERTDNSVTVKYVTPELNEVFEYLDIAGTAVFENVEVNLADGVYMEEITDDEENGATDETIDSGNTIPVVKGANEGSIKLPDIEKKYKLSTTIGGIDIATVLTNKINKIDYKFDIEKVDGKSQINEIYVVFDIEDTVTTSLIREKEIKGTNYQGKYNLATYTYGGIRTSGGTFIGAVGYSVDLNLIISAEGSVLLTCEKKGPVGFQIKDGRFRSINQTKTNYKNLAVSGEFEIGPELEYTAYILNIKLVTASISLTAGVSATFRVQDYSPLFYCIDGDFSFYLNISMAFIGEYCLPYQNETSSLSQTMRWSFGKKEIHCENFRSIVEECTWDEEPDDPPAAPPIDPPVTDEIDPDDPNFPSLPEDDPSFPISATRTVVLTINTSGTDNSYLRNGAFFIDFFDSDENLYAGYENEHHLNRGMLVEYEYECSCGSWWPVLPHNELYRYDVSYRYNIRALINEPIRVNFTVPYNMSKLYIHISSADAYYKDPTAEEGYPDYGHRTEINDNVPLIVVDIPPTDVINLELDFNMADLSFTLENNS